MEVTTDYQIYQEMSLVSESHQLSWTNDCQTSIFIAVLLCERGKNGTTPKATHSRIDFPFNTNIQMLSSTTIVLIRQKKIFLQNKHQWKKTHAHLQLEYYICLISAPDVHNYTRHGTVVYPLVRRPRRLSGYTTHIASREKDSRL